MTRGNHIAGLQGIAALTYVKGGHYMSKVEDNYENETICIKFCGVCPTYPGVKGELLFCARGKSNSPKQKAGCNCGICDVWNKYELTDFYYCIEGAAK